MYFGYNERLGKQPLFEDAYILVFAASDTSMRDPGRQDHAQTTQRPTQRPTQSRLSPQHIFIGGVAVRLIAPGVGARLAPYMSAPR